LLVLILVPGTVLCLSHLDTLQQELSELQDKFGQGIDHLEKVRQDIVDAENARKDLRMQAEKHREEIRKILETSQQLALGSKKKMQQETERTEELIRRRDELELTFHEISHKITFLKESANRMKESGESVSHKEELLDPDLSAEIQAGGQVTTYMEELDRTKKALEQAQLRLKMQRESSLRLHEFRNHEQKHLLKTNQKLRDELEEAERALAQIKEENAARERLMRRKLKKAEQALATYESDSPTAAGSSSRPSTKPTPSPEVTERGRRRRRKSQEEEKSSGIGSGIPGVPIAKGDRVSCLSPTNVWRVCDVRALRDSSLYVHYQGFDPQFDEWIAAQSPRIRPVPGDPVVMERFIRGSSRTPPPVRYGLGGEGYFLAEEIHDFSEGTAVDGFAALSGRGSYLTAVFRDRIPMYSCTKIEFTVDVYNGNPGELGRDNEVAVAVLLSRDGSKGFKQFGAEVEVTHKALNTGKKLKIRTTGLNPLPPSSPIKETGYFQGERDRLYAKAMIANAGATPSKLFVLAMHIKVVTGTQCLPAELLPSQQPRPSPQQALPGANGGEIGDNPSGSTGPVVVAITTPLADPEKGPRAYLGCFAFCSECSEEVAGVEGAGMTVDYCEVLCREKDFTLMEVAKGGTCRCSRDENAFIPDSRNRAGEEECNLPCTGDVEQLCGGDGTGSIFALTDQTTESALRKSLLAMGGGMQDNGKIVLKLQNGGKEQLISIDGQGETGGGSIVEQFQNAVAQLAGSVATNGGVMIKAGNIQFHMNTNGIGQQNIVLSTGGGNGDVTLSQKRVGNDISIAEDVIGENGEDPYATFSDDKDSNQKRREEIKAEFQWAWDAYKEYAWGHDVVKPLSMGYEDSYGMALTMIDSLDTMLIMGLDEEFDQCVAWITENLKFGKQKEINLFETTIRVLGGLLGAYSLRPEKILLQKAVELADAMMFAFDTPTGIPHGTLDLENQKGHNPSWTAGHSTVAEVGSIQMEFRLLSRLTGNPGYRQKVQPSIGWLKKALDHQGLFTQFISPETGRLRPGVITLGARVDSVYEYFLKLWIMDGGEDIEARDLYERSIRLILSELTLRSNATGLTFIAEKNGHTLLGKMDHLVCFLPGLMALDHAYRDLLVRQRENESDNKSFSREGGMEESSVGGISFPMGNPEGDTGDTDPEAAEKSMPGSGGLQMTSKEYLRVAEELGETCYQFYARSPTHVAPEIVQFRTGVQDFVIDAGAAHSLLRPEAVESFYHLYRASKNPMWRQKAWQVFVALRDHARIESGGYAHIKDVRKPTGMDKNDYHDDQMESFFLSETLKYIYLTFVDEEEDPILFDKFVFNTEAHAFPIHAPGPKELGQEPSD